MKLGAIVRAERRGLGILTRDFATHMQPERVLLVVPRGVRRAGLETHLDWYPDATVVYFDGQLDAKVCTEWLDGLDAVWSAETFYDWRLCGWARDRNVATVCLAMPEWWKPQWAKFPTAWWAPTTYRLDQFPRGTRHVPVPVTLPPATRGPRRDGPFRWLHVAGAETFDDRNGTQALLEASKLLVRPQELTVRTQSPLVVPAGVTVDHRTVEDRWEMYADADGFVMPRRYAGLSLPVLEAFGGGLPTIMTSLSPQKTDWPVQTVETRHGKPVKLFGRQIPAGDAVPAALASMMDLWATDPTLVDEWRAKTVAYAEANSWAVRAPEIRAELERVADLVAA